jgi:phage gpG-like protein
MIALTLTGDAEVAARLSGFPAALRQRLLATLGTLGIALRAAVVANLSGAVLQRRSGRLADAQRWSVAEDGGALTLSVGFDGSDVPYGAIQEFGGTTRAHLIEAKNAKALAFRIGGKLAFAKRVQHPGSHIPERSFLRVALAAMAPDVLRAIGDAVAAETGT